MPDHHRASKPRRRGLWWPYIVLVLAFAAWSLVWVLLRIQIEGAIDRTSADLRKTGHEVSWSKRTIAGYPFRFEIQLTDVKLAEPSGWGLAAPDLKAVAAAYAVDHWVFVAADGLTLSRPGSSPVGIRGQVLRASIADARAAPRFSFEGRKLTFQPHSGGDSFPFISADLAEIHLRPRDADRGELLWRLEGVQTRRAGIFAQVAPLAPLTLRMAADVDKRSQLTGPDWAGSVRRWSDADGTANVTQLLASVGDVSVIAKGGPLTVADDGRLRGELRLTVRQGAAALAALGAAQGVESDTAAGATGDAVLPLSFGAEGSRIGPIRIGPAPRIY